MLLNINYLQNIKFELEKSYENWKTFHFKKTGTLLDDYLKELRIEKEQQSINAKNFNENYYQKTMNNQCENFEDLNNILSYYEAQLKHLWQRSMKSEYLLFQIIDLLKDLKDPAPLIEIIVKKNIVSLDMIYLLKNEYKYIQSLFDDSSNNERHKLLKYLSQKSIEAIVENIQMNKKLKFANLKLNILKSLNNNGSSTRLDDKNETMVTKIEEQKKQIFSTNNNYEKNEDTPNMEKIKVYPHKIRLKYLSMGINNNQTEIENCLTKTEQTRPASITNIDNNEIIDLTNEIPNKNSLINDDNPFNKKINMGRKTTSSENLINDQKIMMIDIPPLSYNTSNLKVSDFTLSTDYLVTKVKEILIENQISQKLFGKALLNSAESTISLLMSKPKSWKVLSRRGREPYSKMYLWLRDTNGLNKLKVWINNYTRQLRNSNNNNNNNNKSLSDQIQPFHKYIQKSTNLKNNHINEDNDEIFKIISSNNSMQFN